MTSVPKPAVKGAVFVASAFALAAGALQIGIAPAYAVAGPTTKYECRDVQTPGTLFPGDEVACTLTVSTTGNDSFTNVVAEVTIPNGTDYESGGTKQGAQKVVFNLGQVTKANSASATLTVMVDGQTPANTAVSSDASVKGFAPNGAFDTTASSNTLTTTRVDAGQGGTKLVARQDTASVNTFGRAQAPITDLVDAPMRRHPQDRTGDQRRTQEELRQRLDRQRRQVHHLVGSLHRHRPGEDPGLHRENLRPRPEPGRSEHHRPARRQRSQPGLRPARQLRPETLTPPANQQRGRRGSLQPRRPRIHVFVRVCRCARPARR